MTFKGLSTAKGIAPSLTPTNPIITADLPDSLISVLYFFFASKVANPKPIGGIIIAT